MSESSRSRAGRSIDVELRGKKSNLKVELGGQPRTQDTPLVCASVVGYSPLNTALRGASGRTEVEQLSGWLRDAQEGIFVALVDGSENRRPIALIQADSSDGSDQNFYEANRPRPDRGIWKDFYFGAVLAAVREADRRWSPEEIELTHPTGGAWDNDLLTVTLEALGYLADDTSLSTKTIRLGCLHEIDGVALAGAMDRLNGERRQDQQEFRDIHLSEVKPETVGAPEIMDGVIVKIQAPRHHE